MTNATAKSIPPTGVTASATADQQTTATETGSGGIGTMIEWIVDEEAVIGAVPAGGYLRRLAMIETEVVVVVAVAAVEAVVATEIVSVEIGNVEVIETTVESAAVRETAANVTAANARKTATTQRNAPAIDGDPADGTA